MLQDLPDLQVFRVHKDLRDHRAYEVKQAQQDLLVLSVQPARRELQEHKVWLEK